jgi:alpha-L-fucosidase
MVLMEQGAFPAQYIPPSSFQYNGVNFSFPKYNATGNDNVVALGQNVSVPSGRYSAVYMLASAVTGMASGTINATYSDGSMTSGAVLVPAWWTWPYPSGGDIIFPYYLSNQSVDYNRSNIFLTVNWLNAKKNLTSLQLPNITSGASSSPGGASLQAQLHVFSLSLSGPIPAECKGPMLQVQYARSTHQFIGTNETQVVEAQITNIGTETVLKSHEVTVTVSSVGQIAVQNATIKRLAPGDQSTVQIGVQNTPNTPLGQAGSATILVSGSSVPTASYTFNATYGIAPYQPTYESIYEHESPQWYNNAKYGIFIHWGVYAVPAWGNVGKNETYSEWYWWNLNQGPSTKDQTYEYHLEHYGPDVVYDDFIANFTAAAWDPHEWVDLFADAGAKYFVQVSKHHDGYAIFDIPANVTKRTSVAQFPHRNLLGELFNASKEFQPQLHRATYYSLPEWFHPDYRRYGFGEWPGGNATNPFTNETLPYTGYVPVNEYVSELILPEMNTLADMGTVNLPHSTIHKATQN